MKLFIHIGLPRTASTFLQKQIFPYLKADNYYYNPTDLIQVMKKFLDPFVAPQNNERKSFEDGKKEIDLILEGYKGATILLSYEGLSMEPWRQNYFNNYLNLKKMFPFAKIIVMLRYQTDWVLSLYRLSFQKKVYQSIETFLSFKNGVFEDYEQIPHSLRKRRLNVNELHFPWLVLKYVESFGNENVKLFFFEDFKKDNQKVVSNILGVIGADPSIQNFPYFEKKINTSISAFACMLYRVLFNFFGLFKDIDALSWTESIKNYPSWKIPFLIIGKSYQYVMRRLINGLLRSVDKIIYWNWDLMPPKMKDQLDSRYKEENMKLLEVVSRDKIPSGYLT
ncbi:hypothetical protein EB822_05355 [Flavobacteriaceae bacterium PRS1]|nr:hypothetical protein EB822_05355 [Flavobacteriaceae bacterium PRS1]